MKSKTEPNKNETLAMPAKDFDHIMRQAFQEPIKPAPKTAKRASASPVTTKRKPKVR